MWKNYGTTLLNIYFINLRKIILMHIEGEEIIKKLSDKKAQ